jgi:thiamine biosynthesis protein ThiS
MNTVPTPLSNTFTLTLNGEPQACPPGTTLADLIERQHIAPDAVATALNGTFVARCLRAQQALQAGDSVTTFQPIVGG